MLTVMDYTAQVSRVRLMLVKPYGNEKRETAAWSGGERNKTIQTVLRGFKHNQQESELYVICSRGVNTSQTHRTAFKNIFINDSLTNYFHG